MVHFISLIPHIYCGIPKHSSPSPLLHAEFLKAPFSAQFFSIFIPLLLALSSVLLLSLTSYMLTTQLFISFDPKHFSSAINNLQSTITLISSWMSSNYLTLNPSETEFLLIGLPQQTTKIVNPSLSLPSTKPIIPSLSAKISVLYFTRHCLSPNRFHPSPAPVITIFEIFAASDTLSIPPRLPQ